MDQDRTFKIPAQNMGALKTRLDRLARRADKLGCAPITLEVVEQITETRKITDEIAGVLGERVVEFSIVRVHGEAPKIAGWTFAATIQHTEAGNILRAITDDDLAAFRTVGSDCDHCNKKIARRDTFVLRGDDGALRQVGRNCLADFLGHEDPAHAAAFAQLLADALDGMDEYESDGYGGGHAAEAFTLESFLATVSAACREFGWTSKAQAREFGGEGTATTTWHDMTSRKPKITATDADLARAREAIEWAENVDPSNDYLWNLQVIARGGKVTDRTAGLAASIIPGFDREVARRIEIEARVVPDTLAPQGKQTVRGTILSEKEVPNDWSVAIKWTLLLEDGNKVWITAPKKMLDTLNAAGDGADPVGQTVEITATFTRSDRDEHFAFGKLPRGRFITEEVSA